ncbi:MAG TPA: multicopper oxidase domain-containing protein [Candidatus Binataceae bacterium]|nr:multicopper oxidase domain-containing protein [Candidatus Binataceae bacterium]
MDAKKHRNLTVTMKEIDQQVLPEGMTDTCGLGVTFGKTRVWAYETSDTKTGDILGRANWPAVTIEAKHAVATQIEYVNDLPSFNPSDPTGPGLVQGLIPVDQTIHWADPLAAGCAMTPVNCSLPVNRNNACCEQYTGPVPATVHLHGGELPAAFDGGPDTWFTPDGRTGPDYSTIGSPGAGKAIYRYGNEQEPGTLWFHDHTLGATRDNVYAGLAGFYLIRAPRKEPKKFPKDAYEVELAVQDRDFDTNSQLYFPAATPVAMHPYWSVIFEGDVAIVNGAPWPYMNVEPRRYRFRILNGSNNRSYVLNFGEAPVYQIGADDSYLDEPVSVSAVSIAPAERADVIVDFTNFAGQNITVTNTGVSEGVSLTNIMQFRVITPLNGRDNSCDPAKPDKSAGVCARHKPIERLTDGAGNVAPGVKIDQVRQIVLNEDYQYPNDLQESLNNTYWDGKLSPSIAADFPSDGVSELPRVGSVELWEIANIYAPGVATQTHPVHIHLSQFQVLNRQNIDMNPINGYFPAWNAAFGTGPTPLPSSCTAGQFCAGYGPPLDYLTPNADGAVGGNPAFSAFLQGDPIPPDSWETGWKDTAVAYNRQVLRILVRWTPSDTKVKKDESYAGQNLFPFDPTQGTYVWHCHLINHEDNEMMRPYRVTN